MMKQYVWVMITVGIMGFEPQEIDEFNCDYEELHRNVPDVDYWSYFNWYFEAELQEKEARCYWHY